MGDFLMKILGTLPCKSTQVIKHIKLKIEYDFTGYKMFLVILKPVVTATFPVMNRDNRQKLPPGQKAVYSAHAMNKGPKGAYVPPHLRSSTANQNGGKNNNHQNNHHNNHKLCCTI